jgi:outer membrane lipoprotein SlyB
MRRIVVLAIVVSLVGCAAQPQSIYQPVIDLRPGQAQSLPYDIRECNALAQQRMNAGQAAVAGAIAGALLGAALGAAAGGNSRFNSQMAGVGAITSGVNSAGGAALNQAEIVARCMSGRGYNVLGL